MIIDFDLSFNLVSVYFDFDAKDFSFWLIGKEDRWLFHICLCYFWGWMIDLQVLFLEPAKFRITNA